MWEKLGLIYGPDERMAWASHSALTPTPFARDSETIRVYAGFRDEVGISRIGYVDLDANAPATVKGVSAAPVLDVGRPGTFDDNGLMPGEVIRVGKEVRLYYAGFQMVDKVKFLAFSGVAISHDNGDTFTRWRETPALERSPEGLYIRTAHTVRLENARFRIWYVSGSSFESHRGGSYASYDIYHAFSEDGLEFPIQGVRCIPCDRDRAEYRIGRPRVTLSSGIYEMTFTCTNSDGDNLAGYASSKDGLVWQRDDDRLGLEPSGQGIDAKEINFPFAFPSGGKIYMFYCGDNLGRDGFCCAVKDGPGLAAR